MLITISGFHGTGKSTVATDVMKKVKLRYLSAGSIFRQMAQDQQMTLEEFSKFVELHPEIDRKIDDRMIQEAKKGDVILDGLLVAWLTRDISGLHILLTADEQTRLKRIAQRENRPFDEVKKETLVREKSEIDRFKNLYHIDINDYSIYDVILNTALWSREAVSQLVIMLIKEYAKAVPNKNK